MQSKRGLESPALLEPQEGIDVTAWVGAAERPEFVRQNSLLANIWSGFDCRIDAVKELGKHHANIIDGLIGIRPSADAEAAVPVVNSLGKQKAARVGISLWQLFEYRFINLLISGA